MLRIFIWHSLYEGSLNVNKHVSHFKKKKNDGDGTFKKNHFLQARKITAGKKLQNKSLYY